MDNNYYGDIEVKPLKVSEPGLAYLNDKKQGEYTVEDFFALPEEEKVELIDGVFYNMASPTYIHQGISEEITWQLKSYIRNKNGKCALFYAPCGVQLDQDDKTLVEPDIIIICNRDLIRQRVYYGAPDFIVEILSPSTSRRDTKLKLQKYKNAGVREYWIVDPDKKVVTVYDFEHSSFPTSYGFKDKVPVNIYKGACVVDFADVYERVRFLYE